jgi:hypothetical protein
MMQEGWSPVAYLFPAAILLGFGSYINGACVFGSVGHFGNGEVEFGFTFVGIFAVLYVDTPAGLLPARPPVSAFPPFGAAHIGVLLLALLALRFAVSLKSITNFRRLAVTTGTIGITSTILAFFAPGFTITAPIGPLGSVPVADAIVLRMHVPRQLYFRET